MRIIFLVLAAGSFLLVSPSQAQLGEVSPHEASRECRFPAGAISKPAVEVSYQAIPAAGAGGQADPAASGTEQKPGLIQKFKNLFNKESQ